MAGGPSPPIAPLCPRRRRRRAMRTCACPTLRARGEKYMRNPPILISVLGFFGALPAFEQTGLWGWLAIAAGIAWLAAAVALWSLQPWGWLFAMIIAGLALFEAFLWFLEYPGTGVGFSAAVMPLIIIW